MVFRYGDNRDIMPTIQCRDFKGLDLGNSCCGYLDIVSSNVGQPRVSDIHYVGGIKFVSLNEWSELSGRSPLQVGKRLEGNTPTRLVPLYVL